MAKCKHVEAAVCQVDDGCCTGKGVLTRNRGTDDQEKDGDGRQEKKGKEGKIMKKECDGTSKI